MVVLKKILLVTGLALGTAAVYLVVAYVWALQSLEESTQTFETQFSRELSLTNDQVVALLKIEDPSFWQNRGIDVSHPGQGKTTMTQSVVPHLLYSVELHGWKSGLQVVYRKVWYNFKKIDLGRDVMALAVAQKVPKKIILSIFVQQAYFGTINSTSVTGFSQAAQQYFNKDLSALTPSEFAGLVGMLKSPDHYNPITNSAQFYERSKKVLNVINGVCKPNGLFDTDYASCT